MVGFAGSEHRNLCHAVPVGDVILDEHLSEAVSGRQRIDITVVVVGSHFSDDGNLT